MAHIIDPEKILFYVMSQFSNICMPGVDLDPTDTSTIKDMDKASGFIKEFMPCYIEPSTNKKGRHCYPIFDFTPYVEAYGRYNFPFYANRLLFLDPCSLASLLRLYINSRFNVRFDNIKGCYSQYHWVNFNGRNYLQRTNAGILIKQPKTTTESDFFSLINSPIYSISDIQDRMSWLLDELKGQVPNIEKTELGTYNKASSDFPPVSENADELKPQTIKSPFYSSSLLSYVYITEHFENVTDIATEGDVMKKGTRYLYYAYMKHIIEEGEEISLQKYTDDYKRDIGTSNEDKMKERLEYIYSTNIDRMRRYVFGSLRQKIDMMEKKLGLEQEDINNMSIYNRKLWKREIAITAVWIELCLTNVDYIGKKDWWSAGKGEHYTRELTVPMVSLENFIECLKEKGLTKNGCKDNHRKARALREMLCEMGWMQCVDDSVVIAECNGDKGGRARRYILLPDHPNYKKFEKIVGCDRIEYWKKFRQEQLRFRSVKVRRRRIG